MDFPAILEEIALEGLDGITVEALWKRLNARPGFAKTNLDQDSKNFIWRYLSSVSHLQFYILPVPRADLIIFKYTDCVSIEECKCILPLDTPDDIYSDTQIDHDEIRGSCDYYKERINVTAEVRNENGVGLLSLEQVLDRWGQKFVIVASQKQRNLALFDCAFMPAGISAEMYCTLEAVARGRHEGEISSCRYLRGLSAPKFKTLSQMRLFARIKELDSLGLVTKQQFTLKYANSPNPIVQIRLIHLRRFFSLTKANYRGYLEIVSRYLMSKPNHIAAYQDMFNDLNITAGFFKALRKKYGSYFSSELSHNTSESKKGVGGEKRTRMLKLLKCYVDTDALDDDDDDAGSDEDQESAVSLKNECAEERSVEETPNKKTDKKESNEILTKPYGSLVYHRTLLSQVVMAIQESGERGIMEREVTHKLNMKRNRMRHCMKELLKKKSFASIAKSYGRQNGSFFVTHEVAARLNDKKKKLATTMKSDKPVAVVTKEKEAKPVVQCQQALLDLDEKLKSLQIIMKVDRAEPNTAPDNKKEESERKKLRRANIIKHLTKVKVVNTARDLFLEICQNEKDQGLKETMCRKSFKRILKELHSEGKLYYINIFEDDSPDKMVQQMIVEPNTGVNDVRVKEALLFTPTHCMRHKYKHSATATPPKPKPGPKKNAPDLQQPSTSPSSSSPKSPIKTATEEPLVPPVISVCDILDKNIKPAAPLNIPKGRPGKYGSMAKFERVQVLHRYIFYLLYDYKGDINSVRQEGQEGPTVYLDVEDWRRFLPPLKKHNVELLYGQDKSGVCTVGDLILHMPVHIFCSFVNIRWEVPGLREILDHPYKKFYPIDVLSSEILSQLLLKRHYLTRVREVLIKMCQMGLLTFGPKTCQREREFSTLYLHKKAMLLDTRKSLKGNILTHCPEGKQFDVLKYHFLTMDELSRYWADLKVIGIHSRLGSLGVEDVHGDHGEISLVEAIQPKSLDTIEEDNWLPGDRRGAAGLDSSLFVHKSKNWTLEVDAVKKRLRSPLFLTPSLSAESLPETSNPVVPASSQTPAPTESGGDKSAVSSQIPLKLKRQKKSSLSSKPKDASIVANTRLKKSEEKKTRVPKKKIKKQKIKDDDKDKQAKLQMGKLRSSFTPLENGMLLLFQVTSCILSPNTLSPCVSAVVFRDILQKYLPESKDKTTNALKGKSVRLLRDKKFRGYLASYISQALSDEKIRSKLGSCKRPNIFSAEMEKLFVELFDVVRLKFGSPHTQALHLPGSLSELAEKYVVKHTEDILYNNPKIDISIKSVNDIKTMVVWELIESFLHLKTPLEGKSVFFTLSKYPNEVISEVYYLLRKYSIIVKMKKLEKDTIPLLTNNSALLNNHKCMLRHKEALKSRMPRDLFTNILKQVQEFQVPKREANALVSDEETSKTSDEKQTHCDVAMDVDPLEESMSFKTRTVGQDNSVTADTNTVGGQDKGVTSPGTNTVGGLDKGVTSPGTNTVGDQDKGVTSPDTNTVGGQDKGVTSPDTNTVGGQDKGVTSPDTNTVGGQDKGVTSPDTNTVGGQDKGVTSPGTNTAGGLDKGVTSPGTNTVGGQDKGVTSPDTSTAHHDRGVTSAGISCESKSVTTAGPSDRGATTSGPSDRGVTTSGPSDRGVTTSGPSDGGATTSGPSDGGATTSGPTDGGATTSGPSDRGVTTSGPSDRGVTKNDTTDDYIELNINKYQGGCVMSVISLIALDMVKVKAHIPDEMVRIDEDGKKKLSFKQPQSETDRKRKLAALMDSDEDSLDQWAPEDGGAILGKQRKGMKLVERPISARKKMKVSESASVTNKSPIVEAMQSEDKTIQLGRTTLSLRDVKISASGVLGNFTVWVGSGSLLTLARTSIIEKLDLLTSRCLLQRNFIVESMTLKLALIPADQTKRSSEAGSVFDDGVRETEVNQVNSQVHSGTSPGSTPQPGHQETSLSQCIDLNTMKAVLAHLERCYSPDMAKDDMEAIIAKRLPAALHQQANKMLKIVDSAGVLGITEEDLEDKMSQPFSHLQKLIHQLIMADVVFTAGSVERRFVSRRHAKVWFVEVFKCHDVKLNMDDWMTSDPCKTIIYPCRLWRHFNGDLNPEGLQLLLHRIMTYLFLHPGCPVARLCFVLNPDVLPATTADVLDILELIGCIHVTYIQKLPRLQMFATRSRGQRNEGDPGLKLKDCVRTIHVLVEAPIRLAYFLNLASQRRDMTSPNVMNTVDPRGGEEDMLVNDVLELTTKRSDPKEDNSVSIIPEDIPDEMEHDGSSHDVTSDVAAHG